MYLLELKVDNFSRPIVPPKVTLRDQYTTSRDQVLEILVIATDSAFGSENVRDEYSPSIHIG